MKNSIILFTVFTSFYVNSQSTISLEQYASYRNCETCEPPEDLEYIADLNNSLERYVGNWEGVDGDNKITYKIQRSLITDLEGVRRDALTIRYKVENTNTNQTIISTMDLADDNIHIMDGWNYINQYYYANYFGFEDCGQDGYAILNHNINRLEGERLYIKILLTKELYDSLECPNGTPPSPIPSNIPLTRI